MNGASPKVSVIIPAYNEQGYIGRLLLALTNQSFQDFEVVVSDANSTDKTVEEINGFADKLKVQVIEAPPKNPGGGRNAGAKIAKGEWLLFLDADDDTDDPDFIKTLLEETEAKGWKTSSAKMSANGGPLRNRLGTRLYYSYLKLLTHTKHPIGPGACIFTHSDTFRIYNGFNENITFGEDNDYITRASKEGFGFIDNTHYYVDLRRAEEEGIKFTIKNVRNEFHRLFHAGQLDKTPFEYEYGKHHTRQQD